MKMTLKLTSLTLAILAVTACSGGGGDAADAAKAQLQELTNKLANNAKTTLTQPTQPSSNNTTTPTKTSTPTTQPTPAQPAPVTKPDTSKANTSAVNTTPSVPTTPEKVPAKTDTPLPDNKFVELKVLPLGEVSDEDVGFGKVTGYNRQYSFNGAWKEHAAIGEIVVDQVKLKLAKTLSAGGITGQYLANSLEAIWNATSKNPEREIFYFGDETKAETINNLKGRATYQGNATRYDNVTADLQHIGKSTLVADFDNKKISGELAINGLLRRNISLKEADIKGNAFAGQAVAGENNIILRKIIGQYEGKFFGPNAEEIAGKATFTGETYIGNGLRDLDTSFSAEKVK